MKNLLNLPTEIPSPVEGKHLTYFELMSLVLESKPSEGMNLKAMSTAIKLIDKLGEAQELGEITIAPGEIEYLHKDVYAFNWGVVHRDLVALGEHLTEVLESVNS